MSAKPIRTAVEFVGGCMDGISFETFAEVEQVAVVCGEKLIRYECDQQSVDGDCEMYRLVETRDPSDFDHELTMMLNPTDSEPSTFHRIATMRSLGIVMTFGTCEISDTARWTAHAAHPEHGHLGEVLGETMHDVASAVWALAISRGWIPRGRRE